ncbi:MAG: PspC domain-containing protein [Terriglobales bacterium]
MLGSYCHRCGRANPVRPQPRRGAPLERPREGRKVAGVCLAFARALDWDPNLMRVLWVVITVLFAFVFGVIAYAVAWVLIPEEPALVLAQSDASQPNANGA